MKCATGYLFVPPPERNKLIQSINGGLHGNR